MPMEDFENDHGAIHDFTAYLDLEITRLRRGDFVVDKNDVDAAGFRVGLGFRRLLGASGPALCCPPRVVGCHGHIRSPVRFRFGFVFYESAHLLPLADAHVGCCIEMVAFLRERTYEFESQGLRQLAQFVHRGVELYVAHTGELHRGDHSPQGFFPTCCAIRTIAFFKVRPVFRRSNRTPHSHSIVNDIV